MRFGSIFLFMLLASGCATVKMSRVRPDYDSVDGSRVKRLVVVTSPAPAVNPKLATLWSLMARRYVNQKRNFLVKQNLPQPGQPVPPSTLEAVLGMCGQGLEGVL